MLGKFETGVDIGQPVTLARSSVAIKPNETAAPTAIPAIAPAEFALFHHTPRRKTGVKADPARAKAQVTISATLGACVEVMFGSASPIAAAIVAVMVTAA